MMYSAAKFVRDELSFYLSRNIDAPGDMVVLGSIHEADGTISAKITDKIVISLVGVERVSYQGRAPVAVSAQGSEAASYSAPLHLNLLLLVSASFVSYQEALNKLSDTAAFFQSNAEITRQSSSALPVGIDKLDIQLENLSIHDMSNLWSMMGGKHFPCLLYKLRMISVDNGTLQSTLPRVSSPSVGENS